jgi:hypothetical protein
LPEDLIRLCVGIEDAEDLLDDLENSLLEAGAIELALTGDSRYVRVQTEQQKENQDVSISRAVEKIAAARPKEHREWFFSAPGKVILFGEHAVVHGVVSPSALHSTFTLCKRPAFNRRLWQPPLTCVVML